MSIIGGEPGKPEWLPDPLGKSTLRWWDGSAWTHKTDPPIDKPLWRKWTLDGRLLIGAAAIALLLAIAAFVAVQGNSAGNGGPSRSAGYSYGSQYGQVAGSPSDKRAAGVICQGGASIAASSGYNGVRASDIDEDAFVSGCMSALGW